MTNTYLANIFYNYFASPRKTVREIIVTSPLSYSLLVFSFSLFAHTLSLLVLLNLSGGFAAKFLMFGFPLRWLLSLVVWIISAAVFNLGAEILGGKGRAENLFILIGYSLLPLNLALPLAFLARFFYSHHLPIYVLGMVFIWGMIIYTQIQGIRQIYRFDFGRAIFTWITPLLIIGVVFLLAIVLSAIFIISGVVSLFG